MKYFLLLIFLLLQTLSFANTNENWNLVQDVYQKIIAAKGAINKDLPKLEITDRVFNIAAYEQENNTLLIEEKAISVCQTFGTEASTALAFIIGHELTHFFQQHNGQHDGEIEKEADVNGAMLTYLAGYRSIELVPNLIQALYKAYQLKSKLPNYPPLPKRMEVAHEAQKELKHLIEVYETGNYLAAIGEYTAASDCFRLVGKVVVAKEIMHNQALAMLSAAAQLKNKGQRTWHYPLILEAHNPLRSSVDVEKHILIKKAIKQLGEVLSMDRQYFPAQLNLAIAFSLKEDFLEAQTLLERAKTMAKNKLEKQQCQLLEAILLAEQKDLEKAKALFSSLSNSSNTSITWLSTSNLAVLNNQSVSINKSTSFDITEKIDGIDMNFLPRIEQADKVFELSEDVFSPRKLKIKYLDHSTLVMIELPNRKLVIQRIFDAAPSFVTLNKPVKALKKWFPKENPQLIQLTNYSKLVFLSKSKLILQLDSKHSLQQWAIWGVF